MASAKLKCATKHKIKNELCLVVMSYLKNNTARSNIFFAKRRGTTPNPSHLYIVEKVFAGLLV